MAAADSLGDSAPLDDVSAALEDVTAADEMEAADDIVAMAEDEGEMEEADALVSGLAGELEDERTATDEDEEE